MTTGLKELYDNIEGNIAKLANIARSRAGSEEEQNAISLIEEDILVGLRGYCRIAKDERDFEMARKVYHEYQHRMKSNMDWEEA